MFVVLQFLVNCCISIPVVLFPLLHHRSIPLSLRSLKITHTLGIFVFFRRRVMLTHSIAILRLQWSWLLVPGFARFVWMVPLNFVKGGWMTIFEAVVLPFRLPRL